MRKNLEQLIECTYKITHISAAVYPRFHTHLLSKLVPKLKSTKCCLIRISFNLFINEYFLKVQSY